MKKISVKIFSIIAIAATMITASCKDEFTEEDALAAQQEIDLAIYVFDEGDVEKLPIEGATVVLIQGTEVTTLTTDVNGTAFFEKAKVGGFVYRVSLTDYTSINETGFVNYLQGQETFAIGLYALNGANMATLKGNVQIETDLTNDITEYADGVELLVTTHLNNGARTFITTTDAGGNYSIQIPSDNNGSTYTTVRFPDLELNQAIVYSKLSTNPLNFPDVVQAVQQYPTLFAMYTGARNNHDNFPVQNYRPVYGIAEAAPAGGNDAEISRVFTNGAGEIVDVNFNTGGNYTGDADGLVTITFTSLLGGSGATLVIDLTTGSGGGGLTSSASTAYNNGSFTLTPGSGYPDNNNRLNRNGYEGPTFSSNQRETWTYVYPGTTTFINADYGTGVYRNDNLD